LPAIEARLFPVPPRRRFSPLRWLAGAAVAGALVAAVLTVAFPPAPGLVVALATPDGALRYEAAFRGEALTVTRVAGQPAPAGQVHELWLLAPGASPVSLGLLRDAPLRLAYPVPPAGWMLAVSVEAEGGSPSGLPTGPVILTAPIEG
jgi:anti-sigma-K factor RskA